MKIQGWDCTLFNGDCREVISKESINLSSVVVVTDPPFNIGYHYKSYKDRMAENEYLNMMADFIKNPSVIIHYPEALYRISGRGGGISLQGSKLDIQLKSSPATQRHCVFQCEARFHQSQAAIQEYRGQESCRADRERKSGLSFIRLVADSASQECVYRQREASMPDAIGSDEKHHRNFAERCNDIRPFHGVRNNGSGLSRTWQTIHRNRDGRRVFCSS